MSIRMRATRHTWLLILLLLGTVAACGDDDDEHDHPAGHHDAGPPVKDAGAKPDAPVSKLPRPGLPRPPSGGLPADLRPPR